jgi:predicted AlkP superfamily phosphohydrolase/phosphomutase
VNFDPQRPANPISAPGSFARELAQRDGRFYTTGIPEDTKALSRGALNEDEFLAQCDLVLEEKIAEYRTALDEFGAGCLFSYFGTTDLVQHMFWRDRDPEHPGRKPEQDGMYDTVIDDLYARMDGLVGEAMAKLSDDDTLIVLSDHGFTTFRRELSVNTWLLENGYLGLLDPSRQGRSEMFINTDWSRTRAYAMGLNALYVNEQGREKHGVVAPSRKRALAEEIAVKLQALRDDDGSKVVEKVYRVADIYPGADRTVAPDLIIGYAEGYRSSWATSLGGVPRYVLRDNRDRWSGTHCVATHLLPGMLLTNRSMGAQDADLRDIAPTILGAFGVKSPNEMQGRDFFAAG